MCENKNQIVDIDGNDKSKNQIVEIATNVFGKYDIYVVNGRLIGIKNHIMDLDNPDNLGDIVFTAKEMFNDPSLPAIYGENTICILVPSGEESGKAATAISDISNYPYDVVKKAKVVIDEYVKNKRGTGNYL